MVETEMSCGDTGELAASTSSRCWILKSVLRLVLVVISLHQRSSRRALPLTSREECGERDGDLSASSLKIGEGWQRFIGGGGGENQSSCKGLRLEEPYARGRADVRVLSLTGSRNYYAKGVSGKVGGNSQAICRALLC